MSEQTGCQIPYDPATGDIGALLHLSETFYLRLAWYLIHMCNSLVILLSFRGDAAGAYVGGAILPEIWQTQAASEIPLVAVELSAKNDHVLPCGLLTPPVHSFIITVGKPVCCKCAVNT